MINRTVLKHQPRISTLAFFCVTVVASAAIGQIVPPITADQIDAIRRSAVANQQLSKEDREEIISKCDDAKKGLNALAKAEQLAKQLKVDAADTPSRLDEIKKRIVDVESLRPPDPTQLSQSELEQQISQLKPKLATQKTSG